MEGVTTAISSLFTIAGDCIDFVMGNPILAILFCGTALVSAAVGVVSSVKHA